MGTPKRIEDFDPASFELELRLGSASLEKLAPAVRQAREESNDELLAAAKVDLSDALVARSWEAQFDSIKQGKRYKVFSIGDVYVKVLVSDGRYSVFPLSRDGLERLLARHAHEHAAVHHYFGEAVPDTLFFGSTLDFEAGNRFSVAMKKNPFLAQEAISNPQTIIEASAGPIAETPQFRKSLTRLLDSFITMSDGLSLVPDVPGLDQENLLVDSNGQIWVVDTNTLVSPESYHRFGFHFIHEVERLIASLESGHLPGNPQG